MPPSGTRSSLDRVADAALDLTLPRKGSGGLNPEVLARARAVNLELKGDHIVKPFVVAGEGPSIKNQPEPVGWSDHRPFAADRRFADTAAAIAQLDLIIMTDSAVAHLAGSMGGSV
jgi:hypothetical protein